VPADKGWVKLAEQLLGSLTDAAEVVKASCDSG